MAIDKLDKIGADGVVKEFAARGIDNAAASLALSYVFLRDDRSGGDSLEARRAGG